MGGRKENEYLRDYVHSNSSDVSAANDRRKNVGPNLNFAGAEAYKLLRTNIMLSISADIPCKVIGVTSALRGEGKSTTAINLAYALAEARKRVLLIEADMRIPFIAKTLRIDGVPGLSNFLSGQVRFENAIRNGVLKDTLYVVPAGDIPPNPSELLGSARMKDAIDSLAKSVDYIILDIPPITAVSDGLAISKLLTGMIIVVREGYCYQRALSDTVRQLEYLNVKLLGFVMNASSTKRKHYKKYGYRGDPYGYYQNPESEKKGKARKEKQKHPESESGEAAAKPPQEPGASAKQK